MSSLIDRSGDGTMKAAGRAARRARLAPILSWLAILASLAIFLVFVLQAGLFAYLVPQTKIAPPVVQNPDQVTSYESILTGVDDDNQPYRLTAERGAQDKVKPELFHLEKVTAKLTKLNGEVVMASADKAQYDSKLKHLDLEGNVVIDNVGQFTAQMSRARVEVKTKDLASDVPVSVEFGLGTIQANGLQLTNEGADIVFTGGVKARFVPASATAPATGEKKQ